MTDRSGLGPIDLAVLQAIDTFTAGHPRRYVVCTRVLSAIEERTGLGPRYAYEVLLDLARRLVITVPVVSARGNIGDRDFPAIPGTWSAGPPVPGRSSSMLRPAASPRSRSG